MPTLPQNLTAHDCFTPNIPNFLTRTRPRTSSTITLRARATGCGNALRRPVALGGQARADYEFYLCAHPAAAFRLAIDTRDEAALRLLVGLGLPTAEAAAYCARAGWSAGAAILLGRAKRAKKSYSFDDL